MTLKQITEKLKATGMPVAYHTFKTKQNPPYILILMPGSDNFFADGQVYQKVENLRIELYTAVKDPATEEKVEQALSGMGLAWERSERYIQSEQRFQIIYEAEV